MKTIPKSLQYVGADIGNGEIITALSFGYVATTMQRQEGKVYAETKAYSVAKTLPNGDLKVVKHKFIKGQPAR